MLALAPRLAPRLVRAGLTDPRPGAPVPERKRGQTARPLVGGVLLAAALAAGWMHGALFPALVAGPQFGPSLGFAALALGLAFALGFADDLAPGGLGPGAKALGNLPIAAAGALALAPVIGPWWGWGEGAALGLAAAWVIAAVQLANTYDHADGLLAGAAGPALVLSGGVLGGAGGGALLGFLPANFGRGRALLGDGGSHLAGVLIALHPAAWGALWLPALDLTRVLALRLFAGQRPWHGDRRHLGQVLAAGGTSPRRAAAAQALAALPATLAVAGAVHGLVPAWPAVPLGLLAGAAGWALLLAHGARRGR